MYCIVNKFDCQLSSRIFFIFPLMFENPKQMSLDKGLLFLMPYIALGMTFDFDCCHIASKQGIITKEYQKRFKNSVAFLAVVTLIKN